MTDSPLLVIFSKFSVQQFAGQMRSKPLLHYLQKKPNIQR